MLQETLVDADCVTVFFAKSERHSMCFAFVLPLWLSGGVVTCVPNAFGYPNSCKREHFAVGRVV